MESNEPLLGRNNSSTKKIRVLYADTDRMGVVYHGNYFRWFEGGRATFMRLRGAPYAEIERAGVFLPVVEAHAEYLKPALYDDILTITAWVSDMARVQLTFSYSISRGDTVLVRGFTRHAAVDETGRPVRIPPSVKEALLKEATQNNDSFAEQGR